MCETTDAADVEKSDKRAPAGIKRRDIGDMGYVFANDSGMVAGADERCLEEGRELYRVFHNSAEASHAPSGENSTTGTALACSRSQRHSPLSTFHR